MAARARRTAGRTPARGRLAALQALVLDCDGVLTSGDLFYDQDGRRLLRFDARDGFGLITLCRAGMPVAVLSGRPVDVAEQRLRELGVRPILGQCKDKRRGLLAICESLHVEPGRTAFVGDDLPDLPAFSVAGLRVAVGDAVSEVRRHADWVTKAPGGHGAVREVCEAILRARGEWDGLVARLAAGK